MERIYEKALQLPAIDIFIIICKLRVELKYLFSFIVYE